MMEFSCQNCGHQMNAPKCNAGRSCICPQCKGVIFIPSLAKADLAAGDDSNQPEINPMFSEHDKLLLDLESPKKIFSEPLEPVSVPPEVQEQIRQQAIALKKEIMKEQVEPPPQRKYPWPVDIFLYPISQPGLIMFIIFIGVPLLLDLAAFFFRTVLFSLIMLSIVIFAGVLYKIVILFYIYWYLCECIRDSVAGGIRAPETLAITPSAGELFGQMLKLLTCFVIFWGPFIWSYHYQGGRFVELGLSHLADFVAGSWKGQLALAYGILFFPIGLLRVCTFDFFIDALHPFHLAASILAAFLPYCLLAIVSCLFAFLIGVIERFSPPVPLLGYLWSGIEIYLLMIWAHLLGRFYWRYREKLNWGV